MAEPAMRLMIASWPANAAVSESSEEKSASRTRTPDGKVEVEDCRVRTETLKGVERKVDRIVGPRLPAAWERKC
jgi:hypothetical protein